MAKSAEADDFLIQRARQGDLETFNQLVLRYQNLIYSRRLLIMADEEAAADVTQETFKKAFRSLKSYRGGSFKAWLMRIATNLCFDALRYDKRRPQDYIEDLRQNEVLDAYNVPAQEESPEEFVPRAELQHAIPLCITRLNPAQRIVLVLCDVQGYSYLETAEIASLQLGTVKSRLSRARLAMRDCLRGFAELLPDQFRL